MEFLITEHDTDLYREALDLRRRVLRWPLGLEYSEKDIADEAGQTSIIAVEDGVVVGTMQLLGLADGVMKVRQVAVDASMQGTGVGREMGKFAEDWIREQGYTSTVLHARAVVLPFYLKQGYEVVGDEFVEVGLPHRKMIKTL